MENIKDEGIVRNCEDDLSYIKDRASWTQTLSRQSGKIIERLLRLELILIDKIAGVTSYHHPPSLNLLAL